MGDDVRRLRTKVKTHRHKKGLKAALPVLFRSFADPAQHRDAREQVTEVCGGQSAAVEKLILSWLEFGDGYVWLKREHRNLAAAFVAAAEGAPSNRCWELAFTHEPDDGHCVLPEMLKTLWSANEIEKFVYGAVSALRSCGENDLVLRPRRDGTRISRESLTEGTPLEVLHRFDRHGLNMVWFDTFVSVRRLVDLTIQVCPHAAARVVGASDHPVLLSLSSQVASRHLRQTSHDATLDWISSDYPPTVIAAGIHETMKTVNALDRDAAQGHRLPKHHYSTELRGDPATLKSASAALIARMLTRLGALHETQYGVLAGGLFSTAEYVLLRNSLQAGPRVDEICEGLEKLTATRVESAAEPEKLLEALLDGMLLPPRHTTTRHLCAIAEILRFGGQPKLAMLVHRRLLQDYEAQLEEHLGAFFYVGNDRAGVAWSNSVGHTLAILTSRDGLDVALWLADRLAPLGLEIWDYEEDHQRFHNDLRIALHVFTVCAVCAMVLKEIGETSQATDLMERVLSDYLPLQDLIHRLGVWLTDSGEQFAEPTVTMMMLRVASDPSALRSVLRKSACGAAALAAVLQGKPDSETRSIAIQHLRRRFDRMAVNEYEAAWWIAIWHELGDPARGLRAADAYGGTVQTDRETGWKIVELGLSQLEGSASLPAPETASARQTVRETAAALWGVSCPEAEEKRRQAARARMNALGLSSL